MRALCTYLYYMRHILAVLHQSEMPIRTCMSQDRNISQNLQRKGSTTTQSGWISFAFLYSSRPSAHLIANWRCVYVYVCVYGRAGRYCARTGFIVSTTWFPRPKTFAIRVPCMHKLLLGRYLKSMWSSGFFKCFHGYIVICMQDKSNAQKTSYTETWACCHESVLINCCAYTNECHYSNPQREKTSAQFLFKRVWQNIWRMLGHLLGQMHGTH